jgi:hypothetical protein
VIQPEACERHYRTRWFEYACGARKVKANGRRGQNKRKGSIMLAGGRV